jgi:polysaccharide export outer membrane protein
MKLNKRIILYAAIVLLAAACGTPKNIVYFQDLDGETILKAEKTEPIRLKPMDQISVIVNSRDPQVSAMFNLPHFSRRIGESQSLTSSANAGYNLTGSNNISGYTVDSDGNIDFPVIGKIFVMGLTREETVAKIHEELIESRQIKDPVVTVEFMNLGFSILGEVSKPGRYRIDRDRFTLFDALSLAGDLTIEGRRDNITLIRHDGIKDRTYQLNMLDAHQLYASPAFYIQQGDVIYVTPSDKRIRQSTINGNNVRSTSFWFSVASLAASLITLVLKFI